MSTRSDISILKPDGTVTTQYIHMDGYLSGVGQTLLNNYKTMADAEKIMQLGEYHADSILPEYPKDIASKLKEYKQDKTYVSQGYPSLESMQNALKQYTEYPRDYGQVAKTLNSDIEYHYLYAPNKDGKYQWHTINRDGIEPLTQKSINLEQEIGITEHSPNWQKAPNGQWNAPLNDKELSGLNKGIHQMDQNLKDFNKREKQTSEKSKVHSKKKLDLEAWKKQHTQTVEKLKNGLLEEIEHYTQSPEKVVELLEFINKFHNYSARNALLIQRQRPGAVAVGSFAKFKELGYNVKKGEKGSKIFVPAKITVFYRKDKDGKQSKTSLKLATESEKEKIKKGQIKTYDRTIYKLGTVFDATQTDMPKEKYPELYPNRHQDFKAKNPEQLDLLEQGLRTVAANMNMPVITYDSSMQDVNDPQTAKGYFNTKTNQIVLNQYNTPTENVTVLAHELGHAQLHNNSKQEKGLPRELKEMQAELTSYLYASNYGIDSRKETVNYIAGWTQNGKKFNELPTGVKGQIIAHSTSAAKVLTKATDKVIQQEQARIDGVKSLVSKDVEEKIQQNAKQETIKPENDHKSPVEDIAQSKSDKEQDHRPVVDPKVAAMIRRSKDRGLER
ncbi:MULTISPECIES: ArdC-like ssDNA-binding domain-containing protein [Lactobacillus]|uniref:ImmA/IrrE family metallo-endopeptidase n=1 Tax=Lactobacillus xujianguonis TaxID=2495899 RepID=A0A437SWC1_9LACO|nr:MULTISPECIES: ArdC-like ssDNA-binding domain-containing protein [Lactobacillus]RVU71235.1 ImmA/IrrE family metallo-endopeptidase [Lactobacillus xujianguonis]